MSLDMAKCPWCMGEGGVWGQNQVWLRTMVQGRRIGDRRSALAVPGSQLKHRQTPPPTHAITAAAPLSTFKSLWPNSSFLGLTRTTLSGLELGASVTARQVGGKIKQKWEKHFLPQELKFNDFLIGTEIYTVII